MADSLDVAQLKIEILETGLAEARAKVDAFQAQLQELQRQYKAGEIDGEAFFTTQTSLAGALQNASSNVTDQYVALMKLRDTTTEAAKETATLVGSQGTAGMRGLESAAIAGARSFRAFSGAGGDLGQSFNAMSRSLPTLLAPLGGLGIALAFVSIGASALYENWDKLMKKLGLEGTKVAIDGIEALKTTLKELEAKTTKLAIDYSEIREAKRELAELQRDQAEYDAQHKSTAEKTAGGVATEMLADAEGGEDAIKGKIQANIANTMNQRDRVLQESLAEEEKELQYLKETEALAGEGGAIDAMRIAAGKRAVLARERANAQSEANEILAERETGNMLREAKERGKQGRLAGALRGAGEGDLATKLEIFATPEAARAKDEETRVIERGKQMKALDKTLEEQATKKILASLEALKPDEMARDLLGLARKEGGTPEAQFERVRAQIEESITTRLKAAGIVDPKSARETSIALTKRGETKLETQDTQAKTKAEQDRKRAETDQHKIDAADLARIKAEAGRIEGAMGKSAQARAELGMARNRAFIQGGGRVADTAAEEKRLKKSGQEYALPPGELARRQQSQMFGEFRRAGATPLGAQMAAVNISEKAQSDLQKRMVQLDGSTLSVQGRTLNVVGQLDAEVTGMMGQLRDHTAKPNMLTARSAARLGHAQKTIPQP